MKGIILAGGSGTRLHPLTLGVSKQLLPVYDKPMIYYPLCTLMMTGVREILVITTPRDAAAFASVLGDGSRFGVDITQAVQPTPEGLAQGLLIGRDHIGGDDVAMVLGDNFFHGAGLGTALARCAGGGAGATIFAHRVRDPRAYGVVELDADGRALSLEEKPEHPRSPYAVSGLYLYDGTAADRAADVRPSGRGELEITDVNRSYLEDGTLRVQVLPRGTAWLDMGTTDQLHEAAAFVRTLQSRQGQLVCAPEEVAWRLGYLDDAGLERSAAGAGSGAYGERLRELIGEERDEVRAGAGDTWAGATRATG